MNRHLTKSKGSNSNPYQQGSSYQNDLNQSGFSLHSVECNSTRGLYNSNRSNNYYPLNPNNTSYPLRASTSLPDTLFNPPKVCSPSNDYPRSCLSNSYTVKGARHYPSYVPKSKKDTVTSSSPPPPNTHLRDIELERTLHLSLPSRLTKYRPTASTTVDRPSTTVDRPTASTTLNRPTLSTKVDISTNHSSENTTPTHTPSPLTAPAPTNTNSRKLKAYEILCNDVALSILIKSGNLIETEAEIEQLQKKLETSLRTPLISEISSIHSLRLRGRRASEDHMELVGLQEVAISLQMQIDELSESIDYLGIDL